MMTDEKLDEIIELLASINQNISLITNQNSSEKRHLSDFDNKSEDESNKIIKAELERTQAMLLHSEKMASLGSMAAGVAHELNNPLAWIMSNFQIIEEKYLRNLNSFNREIDKITNLPPDTKGEEIQKKLKSLKAKLKIDFILEDITNMISESMDGAVKMRTIVEGLRSFAHTDTGEFVESKMSDILDSAITIAFNQIKYVAKIHKEYQAIPPCEVIPSRLSQVFLNLIINAVQAIKPTLNKKTKPLGNLWVRIKNADKQLIVEIEDDGEGIAEENLSRIFDPFFTTKKVGEGTGLGLPIVYKIVEEHRGRIDVWSEKGKGTKFSVILPFNQPKESSHN